MTLVERLRDYSFEGDTWVLQQEAADRIAELESQAQGLSNEINGFQIIIERQTREINELQKQKNDFQISYRMKCDAETKELAVRIEEMERGWRTKAHVAASQERGR
jgi:hypothetical protein